MRRWLALGCVLVWPRLGHGQASHPWSVYLRDGGRSPLYAFASYSFGRPVLTVGAIVDTPNDYTESLAGGGVNLFAASGNGASLLALGSKATDSWYLEVYGLPTLTVGRLSATGFAGLYIPVESRGVRQYFLDPVTVLGPVRRRLRSCSCRACWTPSWIGSPTSSPRSRGSAWSRPSLRFSPTLASRLASPPTRRHSSRCSAAWAKSGSTTAPGAAAISA